MDPLDDDGIAYPSDAEDVEIDDDFDSEVEEEEIDLGD